MDIISFKNVAGLMLIPGVSDGVNGLFALDSGAMRTVLNKKYFPNFEGKSADVAVFDSSMADKSAAEIIIPEFSVGRITVRDLPAMLIDMSYVENSLRAVEPDVCFYGSLGMDFFGDAPILLDYEHSQITVDPTISTEKADKIEVYPGALPTVSLEIGGEARRFVLDTGANTCLLSADLADKIAAAPLEDSPGVYVIPKIKAGGHEYRNVNAVFSDISQIRANVEADGVIGAQILSEQLSLIDFGKGWVYLY